MDKKIIVKASSGLGDQMFMYAHAYALAKKLKYKLFIDDRSAYFQSKNRTYYRSFALDCFNLTSPIASNNDKYDNFYKHNVKKILKLFDKFKNKKNFLQEHQDIKKKTYYKEYNLNFTDHLYVEGGFRSEKYFANHRNALLNEFIIKNKLIKEDNKYIKLLKDTNSVSIHVRRNRFKEPSSFSNTGVPVVENISLDEIFKYIKKAINYFENKIQNPKFFIWSNNFQDLDQVFDKKKFIYIENNNFITDFYLFKFAKHFIVSPSSYHWWGAWLNNNKNKICIRPPDYLNPSNNLDFWPENWQKID